MKKLFTLSLLALISMLTFAQDNVEITSEKTVEFYIDETYVTDLIESAGKFQVVGEKINGITVYATFYSKQFEGTYDYNDIDSYTTGVYDNGKLSCFDIKATIAKDRSTMDMYTTNGVLYHVILNMTDNPGDRYDKGHEALDAKYSWDEITIDDSDAATSNTIYVGGDNAEGRRLNLEFNCTDASNGIPTGKYTIDDSKAPGTVLATGLDMDYGIILGSFVGDLDEEGYINIPFWWMASGTVTVEEGDGGHPHILVDAKTTWGVTVTVEIDSPVADAIKDVNTVGKKAQKVVRDGQLRILSAGKEYNAKGMLIK